MYKIASTFRVNLKKKPIFNFEYSRFTFKIFKCLPSLYTYSPPITANIETIISTLHIKTVAKLLMVLMCYEVCKLQTCN